MNVFAGSQFPWFPLPHAWRAHAVRAADSVLLETAGGLGSDHVSYLFTSPEKVLRANSADELFSLLEDVETARRQGFYAAGVMSYEAGYSLHNIAFETTQSLACFGLYREAWTFDHHTGIATGAGLPSSNIELSGRAILSPPQIQIDRKRYAEKFAAVQRLLAAGDTYQVNLTTRVDAELPGTPLALYESLIEAQPVDFAAIVHFGESLVLSFSPELFFRTINRRIVTRPMKGTAPRGSTPDEDAGRREWLARDEKNHAEHVMIVDLLRNDLGRICEPGTVRAEDLFRVEPYPTLFQMTSTITGELREGARFGDILRALYPSGSVTGAPKRRTMEIIRELEDTPRGVYTGAIGFVSPEGDACFSVPIRTIQVRNNAVSMGVGGGVVADSTADAEYDECLLKASFLNKASTAPQLIETLLWNDGYPLLDLHLARLAGSAEQLKFRCDVGEIRAVSNDAAVRFAVETRVRLLLSADGEIGIESGPLIGPKSDLRVRVAARHISSANPWLRHKTTRRSLYEREFARARMDGFDEVLFLNERGEFAEGSISNIFAEIDGRLYTPPLGSGVLPGVLRRHLLDTDKATEKVLRPDDPASALYVGNALRGLRSIGSLHVE